MIPQADIIDWQHVAPWGSPDQVEHDLVLSRAISELYAHPMIAKSLVFRGGTALHKLYFEQAGRFSEDLDFVQVKAEPIGNTVTAIRDCLDHWLGKPSWKQNQGRFTLNYRFMTELEPVMSRKVKIEINTREHFSVQPYVKKTFQVNSPWFQGSTSILTYSIEELLATKLRALYQRKKGRDLYDLWYVMQQGIDLDIDGVIRIFEHYMQAESTQVSRAEFEENLFLKQKMSMFGHDIGLLLSTSQVEHYRMDDAYRIVFQDFLTKLKGDPWKKFDNVSYAEKST